MATSHKDASDRRKLALLIGNGDYNRSENKLSNSINNIERLDNLLKTISFDVTTVRDLSKQEMATNINAFSKKIGGGDLIFIYYYGHGYSVKEKNYLIPIDDERIGSLRDVEDFGFNIESPFSRLVNNSPSFATILILDCCRPYVLKGESGATGQ
jgi:hypothetical protein